MKEVRTVGPISKIQFGCESKQCSTMTEFCLKNAARAKRKSAGSSSGLALS